MTAGSAGFDVRRRRRSRRPAAGFPGRPASRPALLRAGRQAAGFAVVHRLDDVQGGLLADVDRAVARSRQLDENRVGNQNTISWATARGVMRSRPPEMTTVGQLNFGISAVRS